MPNGVKKADLPAKVCEACDRPFSWRKKWARDWDAVRYCSDRCRDQARRARQASTSQPAIIATPPTGVTAPSQRGLPKARA